MEKTEIEETKEYLYYIYKAKNTLWYFNDLIKNGFSEYNSVKFQNTEGIYIWLENVKIEDNNYLGNLADSGLSQKIPINEVIDWMIIERGRLIGGYTIRSYRDTLNEDEKLNFDIDFGVTIDDGNDFFKPDLSTPEGAIIKIENYYSDKNLEGILSCKNFLQEAEILLEEKGLKVTEELKIQVAETLKVSLIESLQSNGFPYFKNIERIFTLEEKLNDRQLIKEKVIYPDGSITFNKLWVGHSNGEWRVLNNVD